MNHQTIVDPSARIASNVEIGPWSIIGPEVTIGEGCTIGPHVVIQGPTTIGCHNQIHAFSSIGADSQDKKFEGERAVLHIGDHNIFREFTSVHRGTKDGGGITRIGNHNLIMNYAHIAHDCTVGSHNVLSNNATLAGHVILGSHVIMGGFAAAHQFVKIGDHAFIAAKCTAYMDVIPFVLVGGDQGRVCGLNTVGLKRRGFSREELKHIKSIYQCLFNHGLSLREAVQVLNDKYQDSDQARLILAFIEQSERGLLRPKQTSQEYAN